MDLEELEPRKKLPTPPDLDRMSIEELKDYIASMEAEIARREKQDRGQAGAPRRRRGPVQERRLTP
jgi:uncharacterized small protein (DUF1192 family)